MTSLTISLPDEIITQLNELAQKHNISTEELIRASVQELVSTPEEQFEFSLDYLLEKNAELYKRLA